MRRLFLLLARVIRALPPLRGKVRLGHGAYQFVNRRNSPYLIDTTLYHEKLRFRLNLTSAHERMAFLMNGYENDTVELLESLYTGGSIVDVGANIGLIAIPLAIRTLARSIREPHLFAFEVLPSNRAALASNVSANRLNDIVAIVPHGLGAERKRVHIQIEGNDASKTGTANILPESFAFEKIAVDVERLDDLVRARLLTDDVTLMKIDTDGYDLEVLRGARAMLRERRPVCHVEFNLHCHAWHGTTIDDIVDFVDETDYVMYVRISRDSGPFQRYRRGSPFLENVVLVPEENTHAHAAMTQMRK